MRFPYHDPVESMLKRRGFELILNDPSRYLLFPAGLDRAVEDSLYSMLKKYSFRLVVRDVIRMRKSFGMDDLLRYASREAVSGYLEFLLGSGIVKEIGGGLFCLKSDAVFSFGDTLEWFVAQVFKREFDSPAIWGARLSGVSSGGDYDVIASVEGRLVYAEVKSSPPKNVEKADVSSFLKRAEALRPSMALFIEDTRLRMKDKIAPFFEEEANKHGLKVERVEGETFSIGDKVYITNSKPDIVSNIGLCLSRHLLPAQFLDIEGR